MSGSSCMFRPGLSSDLIQSSDHALGSPSDVGGTRVSCPGPVTMSRRGNCFQYSGLVSSCMSQNFTNESNAILITRSRSEGSHALDCSRRTLIICGWLGVPFSETPHHAVQHKNAQCSAFRQENIVSWQRLYKSERRASKLVWSIAFPVTPSGWLDCSSCHSFLSFCARHRHFQRPSWR